MAAPVFIPHLGVLEFSAIEGKRSSGGKKRDVRDVFSFSSLLDNTESERMAAELRPGSSALFN